MRKSKKTLDYGKKALPLPLLRRIEELVSRYSTGPQPPPLVACWDLDGTLIDGDITEGKTNKKGEKVYLGLLEWGLMNGFFPSYKGEKDPVAKYWADYGRLLETGGEGPAYLYTAELFTTIREADLPRLEAMVLSLLPDYYQPHLFGEILEVLTLTNKLGVHNYIISASPHAFVSLMGAILPIPKHHCFGIERRVEDGKLIDPIVNYAAGKTQRTQAILASYANGKQEAQPILAAGNSWRSDGPMVQYVCSQGGIGIMVNAGPAPAWADGLPIYQLEISK